VKKVYIIPGFRHKVIDDEYTWLASHAESVGYKAVLVHITWNNRVMSDYVHEFLEQYEDDSENIVVGFSFGAMIAAISASKARPNKLILLSLSPYFSEDIPSLRNAWKKNIGSNRAKGNVRKDSKNIWG